MARSRNGDESRPRRPTATARFGSSRRESHDATGFYERFVAPELSTDATVVRPSMLDVIHEADARSMSQVESDSIALVVTSPPYFAGKQYEESLGENGVPGSYFEYLDLLRDVFAECKRVLEPGGRIAVNVANLGRRPYRSLAGDVTTILQDLGLLLRGEVVWWKGRAAGGSCAWGTFQRPNNPVLRDVTERIVIASKGRFDRAVGARDRARHGLPSVATITRDEFLDATTDLWEIPPESATRVGHPAPFPVELPQRLIELYTYEDDVVLDPFMGSGSTAVAAVRTDRHYIGFDTDPSYIAGALERVGVERETRERARDLPRVHVTPLAEEAAGTEYERALREGRLLADVAAIVVRECGFTDVRAGVKPPGLGVEVDFVARDARGQDWAFGVAGGLTSVRGGLRRADTLWKMLATAAVLHQAPAAMPFVVLTTDLPGRTTPGHAALQAVRGPGKPVFDVVEVRRDADRERLRDHARTGRPER